MRTIAAILISAILGSSAAWAEELPPWEAWPPEEVALTAAKLMTARELDQEEGGALTRARAIQVLQYQRIREDARRREVLEALLDAANPEKEPLMNIRMLALQALRTVFYHRVPGSLPPKYQASELVDDRVKAALARSMDPAWEPYSFARAEAVRAFAVFHPAEQVGEAELRLFVAGLDARETPEPELRRAFAVALTWYTSRLSPEDVEAVAAASAAATEADAGVRNTAVRVLSGLARRYGREARELEAAADEGSEAELAGLRSRLTFIHGALARAVVAETEPDLYVRRATAVELGYLPADPQSLMGLVAAADSDNERDEGVRLYAAASLGQLKIGDPQVMERLTSMLNQRRETSPAVREQAAIALRCFTKDPSVCVTLERALDRETDEQVRGAIRRSLEVLRSDGNIRYLEGPVSFPED